MTDAVPDWSHLAARTACRRGSVPRSRRALSPEQELEVEAGVVRRSESGDVVNRAAFEKRMAEVGEEDQSVPGWDQTP